VRSRSVIFLAACLFFLLAGLVLTYYSFQLTTPEAFVSKTESLLTTEIEQANEEASILLKRLKEESTIDLVTTTDRFYLVYDRGELVFWSSNGFVPELQTVSDTFSIKLLKTSSGDYLAKKWPVDESKILISIIPLYRAYKIKNNYLNPTWNKKVFPQGNVKLSEPGGPGIPVCIQGKCILNISFLDTRLQFHEVTRRIALVLFFLSLLSYVLFSYDQLQVIKKKSVESGFLALTLFLVPLRLLMVFLNFPNNLIETELFNPENFASSNYNASLGDLLLNEALLLAICYYVFKNYMHFKFLKLMYGNRIRTFLFSIFCALGILFAFLFPFVVIQTLFNNSSIPLDIAQSIRFDFLRVAALLAILGAWGCAFLFSHVAIRLLISKRKPSVTIVSFLIGVVLFILINLYTGQEYITSLLIGCFYFTCIYVLKLYASLQKLSYATFVYLFVTVFCLSINSGYAINYFSTKEKIESQFRFASNFLIDRDYFGEYLLNEVSMKIERDAFIRSRMSSPFLGKDIVRQKIRQVFLPTYFNKYDVEIFLFNSTGDPFENRSSSTFSELIGLYDAEAFRTEYKEVHFINSPSADVTQKYLVVVPINRFNSIAGYVVVELSLKKVIPENVYPELLVDNRYQQFYKTEDLSYAVFSSKSIVFSAGDFNYEGAFRYEWLGNVDLYKNGIKESGYIHIAQEDELGRAAVVSSKNTSVLYILSNFSFFLVLGLAVILILILVEGLLGYFRGSKLFFSTRIQLFLNISFFLPLIIVSITTLSLTSSSSKEHLDEEYLSKSKSMGIQIAAFLDQYLHHSNEDQIDFENQLTDLAKLTNLDANVYNPTGRLMTASQPLIFENNLLSTYINPIVLKKMSLGENLFVEREQIGSLEYFVSYAALKSPQSGRLIGILGIPFFQSVKSLEKIQIIIFTNILNIFAAIFIVLLLLSFFVSEWLTFPLRFITQTLRKTSLLKTNQPLVWRADDEIGLMVREYNKMLYKLGESKAELEQTQRERAWREIAQQVAHEIKNPLTPMKLMLQQMERSNQSGTNTTEKTEKSLSSLLSQVDTLNDIASSFSSFAKMPEPIIQKLELVSLLRRTIDLHAQTGIIHFKSSVKELFVMGDEQLLSRSFSNIILNAIQSERPGVQLIVNISIENLRNKCLIRIGDNGRGIPEKIIDQVFVPHFTTKKSGSGLGLAIVKQGVEQLGGRIWFETFTNKGTAFYIELPVVD
jgi:two-component system, NtrC family, nitrogen regulation sensor histidine kinase NtrY